MQPDDNRTPAGASAAHSQLMAYARDVAAMYVRNRERADALESTRHQMMRFAEDLTTTVADLRAAHQEMQQAYLDTIHRLVLAAEFKDEDTGDHIVRISRYSALLARELELPAPAVQNILYASPMHDVGKIGIPDRILLKPGRLTADEFEVIKTHTTIGAHILESSRAEILQMARRIALTHHEKWNGKGYPQGLSGEAIPMEGRIVALVDTFDALTSRRPYKDPYPVDVALDIIRKERGEHFDPRVVDTFLEHLDEVLAIKAESSDPETVDKYFTISERDLADGTFAR